MKQGTKEGKGWSHREETKLGTRYNIVKYGSVARHRTALVKDGMDSPVVWRSSGLKLRRRLTVDDKSGEVGFGDDKAENSRSGRAATRLARCFCA
jgi:hypothetical protein